MNASEVRGLTKSYRDFTLGPVDFTLPNGAILGLIGENGAGKTTTIRLILDTLRRDGGTITIFGEDNRAGFPLRKEDIGVVLDEAGLSECLTAPEVGRIMQGVYRKWDAKQFAELLDRLAVPTNKRIKEYSLGMKRKLSIAVALSHRAKLLLLDEPTSGLDPVVRDEVVSIFSEFTRDEEHSILISSHIVSDLEKLCDYIAFLHKGRLLLCEEKDRLHEEYGVLRCTKEELDVLPASAVIGKRTNPYGVEAIVRRAQAPGRELSAVDIEQLFILMAKED